VSPLGHYAAFLAPLLVFGVVVFVHELGHFVAAKLTGVYAPRFSIGFGPALWAHRWGETEYRLSALPLGGYVRMASRDDEAAAVLEGGAEEGGGTAEHDAAWDPTAMMPFGPNPIPADRWFESKPLAARVAIMLSGVAMNIILAFAVFTGTAAYFGDPPVRAVVDSVATHSVAAAAGFAPGDSIVAIDGTPVSSWEQVQQRIRPSAGVPIAVDIVRAGVRRTIRVTPATATDSVLKDGQPVAERIGRVGLAPRRPPPTPIPITRAIAIGARTTVGGVQLIIETLKLLVTGAVSLKSVSGPVGIARYSVQAARSGFEPLLLLLAAISLNVAVFNLLPIPILDGGQIVVTVAEAIRRRPFSIQTRERVLKTGLLAIALLIILVMYNDRCVLLPGLC
jgi:regulator of sigma E protease